VYDHKAERGVALASVGVIKGSLRYLQGEILRFDGAHKMVLVGREWYTFL
jgi:hypothetical protein